MNDVPKENVLDLAVPSPATIVAPARGRRFFGLEKNIFLLGLVSFFNDLSSEMILSVFPAFFTTVLKTGAASLGLVEGIAEGASNIIKIYAGRLSDKIQKRKLFITLGYSLSVAIRPFYIFMGSVFGVAGLRVLDRVGKGLREGPRDAIISLSVKKEELGKSFGYHRAMDTAGALVGPFIAYLLLRKYPLHFNTVFITAFIAGIFAIATIPFIKDVIGQYNGKKLALGSLSAYGKDFKRYLIILFIFFVGSLPVAVMLLKTESLGLVLADIPLFYMLYNISYVIFSVVAGRISDRVGTKKVIGAGYVFLVAGYILLGLTHSTALLILSFLVLGLFPACTDGMQRAYAATLTDEAHRAGAYGLMNAAMGFGAIVAGIFGGFLWQYAGVGFALSVFSAIILCGLILFLRKQKNALNRFS